MPNETTRNFVKERLARGDSAATIRRTHAHLISQPPSFFQNKEWGHYKGLSGADSLSPKEIHRIQSATSRRVRGERKQARATFRARTEASKAEARYLGLPEPTSDYQKAHDAGIEYRATNDERYREQFEEGSP